jgi:hypothetical protein
LLNISYLARVYTRAFKLTSADLLQRFLNSSVTCIAARDIRSKKQGKKIAYISSDCKSIVTTDAEPESIQPLDLMRCSIGSDPSSGQGPTTNV